MADLAVKTVNYPVVGTATRTDLHVAREYESHTALTGEDIVKGAPVRFDPDTGRFLNADASAADTANVYGIALTDARAGQGVTALRRGWIEGINLDALNYDAPVYLSDTAGAIADAAGTTSVLIGRVLPVHGHERNTGTPSKLLAVAL